MFLAPILVALTLAGPTYRERFPLPDLTVPSGWGVNIHFTDPKPAEMEKLRAAGFKWVRMDLLWHAVERKRGVYDFKEYDRLMGHLQRVGVRPVFILCYGNELYGSGAPRSPETRGAFARFALAAVRHFQGRGVVWELWNEPNLSKFWSPHADAAEYVALARVVGTALRRGAPDEWFVGPAVSGFDWPFLETCFEGGLLDLWDAVTVHPYRQSAPETAGADWRRLRSVMGRHTARDVPLLSGEWGYSERYPGQNAQTQADYAVRQYVANLASGVAMSIWYDWKDDGSDPLEIEHHFGTVATDLREKPAYEAIQAAARRLDGLKFDRRLPGGRTLFAGAKPALVEVANGAPEIRDPTPAEREALEIPVPGPEVRVADDAEVRRMLTPSRAALRPGQVLELRVQGSDGQWPARPDAVLTPGLREPIAATVVDRGAEAVRVRLDRVSAQGRIPVYEGYWVHAQPVELHVFPGAGPDELEVRLNALGGPTQETLTVELRIGQALRTKEVRVGPEGGSAVFEWYPWETRSPLSVSVRDPGGRIVARQEPLRAQPVPLGPASGLVLVAEGDPKVDSTVKLVRAAPPGGGPSGPAVRLDYRFDPGWKYAALVASKPEPLAGEPEAMALWVYGDRSGDFLRMRFEDATGQTFQPDLGAIDWQGWKRLTVSLKGDKAGRWGGANDGVVHLPIRITVPALVDSATRRGGSGSIWVAGTYVLGR
ncbi:MAG: hypothetical protein H6534_03105 [Chthonomonadaceae bacterium]|nr:hypothetical protein [Chthonomonadaceae bacterium]